MYKKDNSVFPYILLLGGVGMLSFITHYVPVVSEAFTTMPTGLYLVIGLLFGIGYFLNAMSPSTKIPSFVWAIFFGIALQPALRLLTERVDILQVVVELLAALVLFGGGVEVPFKNFKKYFAPIATLALGGTVLMTLLFAYVLQFGAHVFQADVPIPAILLIGAILASTDPTAIIPSLKVLRFKRPFLRDLAISESALNDVAGTILTRFFLVAVLSATGTATLHTLVLPLFTSSTANELALEILWGMGVGVVGASVLRRWQKRVEAGKLPAVDPALFIAVPISVFALGSIVGGSGFLAAFVCGLLYDAGTHTKQARHFYDVFVDRFTKPIIFLLLGGVVPLDILFKTALFGITAALGFMFVIRPLVVFISLSPWVVGRKSLLGVHDLLFMSFVRETGTIPAVLILVAVGRGVVGADYIFAIGMWVILLTLLIEPPLTPWVAKKLGVAVEKN